MKNRKSLPQERNSGKTSIPGKKTVNISTSQNTAGTEVIDNKGKAAILNGQYDSVFTDEKMNTMPSHGDRNIK